MNELLADDPAQSSADNLLIMLCTYNERENIERLIPELFDVAGDAHILVIDDNSPDGTGDLADEMSQSDPRIKVLHREGKLGLGTATLAGFRFAIAENYQAVINMDADFSHAPRYIPELRDAMDESDVAIASRYVKGGGVRGWGPWRYFMSGGINRYARIMLGLKTKDNSGSFRCYRVSKLAELDLDLVRARGYAFQEEILYRCRRIGCRFTEVPIIFEERRFGQSKINWKEAVSALWVIFLLGLQNLSGTKVTK